MEDLKGGALLADRLPSDEQHVKVLFECRAHARDGHGLILGHIEVLPREEPPHELSFLVDSHLGARDLAPVGRVESGQALIDHHVATETELLAPRERALGLGLKELDADDTERHQHHAQMNDVAAVAASVASCQPKKGNRYALPMRPASSQRAAPELIQRHQRDQAGQPVSEQRRAVSYSDEQQSNWHQ